MQTLARGIAKFDSDAVDGFKLLSPDSVYLAIIDLIIFFMFWMCFRNLESHCPLYWLSLSFILPIVLCSFCHCSFAYPLFASLFIFCSHSVSSFNFVHVQAIGLADSFIPNEMKDFLSVEGIFDGFIDIVVGAPIDLSASQLRLFPIESFVSYVSLMSILRH